MLNKLLAIWLAGGIFLWGFDLGTQEFCAEKEYHNPVIFLGWPIAMIALSVGATVEERPQCVKSVK